MYGTGNDGYLIRERNAELLREVGVTRLERRLRSNKRPHTGARGLRPRTGGADGLVTSGDGQRYYGCCRMARSQRLHGIALRRRVRLRAEHARHAPRP